MNTGDSVASGRMLQGGSKVPWHAMAPAFCNARMKNWPCASNSRMTGTGVAVPRPCKVSCGPP